MDDVFKIDRICDSLRLNPRFIELMKKCHFEEGAPAQK
jgi:hypothetical protein